MHHELSLRAKLIIMVSVMASLFLVALDQTIISTALGTIVEEFNAFDSLSLIVTSYLLTTTITVPIAGKLSDLFGRRKLLLGGIVIFALGSLFSALAGDITTLVAARAFQGIGGGIITANAFTIVGDLFAARERGKWQGMIGAVFGLSSLVGPLLGGYLTDHNNVFGFTTDWRWTFGINVPIAIVAFIVIAIYCPSLKHAKKPRIDYRGAAFLTVALSTLVLAVDNTDKIFAGVLDTFDISLLTLRTIMAAIIALSVAGFIATERKAAEPILPLYFFKNGNFTKIMGIATLFGAAFIGSILYLTQFNQQVFVATPTESGLMLLPMIGGLMVTSIGGGQIISKTGKYKVFMILGISLATAMVFGLTTLTPETPYVQEAIIILFLGMGLGIVMPVINLAVQNEFSQRELGVATSSNQLFRSLGSTIGVALFGAMLTSGITTSLGESIKNDAYVQSLSQNSQVQKIGSLDDSNTLLTINTPDIKQKIRDGVIERTQNLPESTREQTRNAFIQSQDNYSSKITHAFSESLKGIFTVAGSLMMIGVVLVFMLKERELQSGHKNDTPGLA